MDIYGVSNAVNEQNSLHGQIALAKQLAETDYQAKLTEFNNKIRDRHTEDSKDTSEDVAKDLPDLNDAYQTIRAGGAAVQGAARGAQQAEFAFRQAPETIARKVGVARRAAAAEFGDVERLGPRGVSSAAGAVDLGAPAILTDARDAIASAARATGSAVSSAASATASAAGTTAELATEGARYGGAVGAGALSGAVSGLREFGGAPGELGGIERIASNVVTKLGGGSAAAAEFGGVVAKGVGAAGGIIAGVQEATSLINTGNLGMRLDTATGKYVKQSGFTSWSQGLTELGTVADLAAAATGGLAVPIAAALNLAGAVTGVIGEIKDQKSDDASAGIGPDGKPTEEAPTKPTTFNSEAFTSLGFVGNLSHNPLDHIN